MTYWPRAAKAVLIAGFFSFLVMASALAILLPPALKTWRAEESCTYASLLQDGLPKGPVLSWVIELEANDFIDFLIRYSPDGASPHCDPWLFAALVVGYLRLHNVPLWEQGVAAVYSTATRKQVLVEPDDTWGSLSERYLGGEELWPLLLLLNREWVLKRGLKLEPGRWIAAPVDEPLG